MGSSFCVRDPYIPYYGEKTLNIEEEIVMLFEKKFKVVEVRESGATITHYLKGKRQDVKKDVEMFKLKSKRYEMVGKDGMIVWA